MSGPGTTVSPGPDVVRAPDETPAVVPARPTRRRFSIREIAKAVVWPLVAFVVFLSIWQLISSSLSERRKFILPSPGAVARDGFGSADVRRELVRGVYFTAKEALLGLAIAAVIGISLAVLMSQARWIERSVFPWAVALQTIPILALVPFISIRYGYGFKSRVIVCVLIAVFPIVTNTLFGLQSADEGHHDLFTLHRAGRRRRLWKLQFPGALPAIFTGLRISAGLAVVGAIVGEFFFRRGDPGLGLLIEQHKTLRDFDTDPQALFATIIATCLLGIMVFGAVSIVAWLTMRKWYEPAGAGRGHEWAGTSMGVPWGVWFEPTQPVRRLVDLAQRAERLGARACFVADEGTERDVYVAMTAILLGTEAMTVAPAITNPFSRHPVTTAAAIATLAEMAPGRVWHGLGVGGSRVLEPLGLAPARPYTALVDAFDVDAALLAGESVGAASIPWTPGVVPVAVAGRGPRVQQLAASRADWVIFSAKPRARLAAEAARVRSAGSARIVWSAYVAWSPEQRTLALRHFSYMAVDAPPDIRAATGLDDERLAAVRSAMLAGRMDDAAALLPPALLDQYGIAGTPDECAAAIAAERANFDLFMLPMNDEATCEGHIDTCAAILSM